MTEQPKEEYTITIRIKLPQGMDEKRAEEYIKQFLKPNGWGAWFASNYIHVVDFVFSRPTPAADAPSQFPKVIPESPVDIRSTFDKRNDFLIWLKAHDAAVRKEERERVIKRFFELEENGIPECKSRKCSANDDPYPCNKCIFDYILAESLRREGELR